MKEYIGKHTGEAIDLGIALGKTSLQDVNIKVKVELNDSNNDFTVDVNQDKIENSKEIELIFNVPSNNNSGGGGGDVEYNIDDELSLTSINPVQNKVITEELNKKGTYSKPNTGIPKNDLSNSVQESLNKADNALQSYKEQYTGTVKGIKMNGELKGNSGIVDLGTVLTEHQDVSDFITEDELNDYATKTWVSTEIAKAQLNGDDVDLSGYATKDDIKDLASEEWVKGQHYATTSQLDDKVDKVNGKQLSTEDFTTLLKQKLENLSNYDDTYINNAITSLQTQLNTLLSGNANDAINSFNEIIAFLEGIKDSESLDSIIASIEQQIASKQDKITDLSSIRSGAAKGETAVQPGILSKVATSGSYNDLSNKPTIPSAVTESTVSGWGFTKNTGTYSKPSTGIPKTDLSSSVQTSLNKANTALQSYTEQYKGTVTGVKVNGSTKNPSNGIVDLGTVITSHQDISGKQDKLVSGTNIKTINGQSILGNGNLTIDGGDSSIITFETIYPQQIGDAVTFRVPAGAPCILTFPQDFTPTANTYIEIIFEGVPTATTDYVVSKYHIHCYHYGLPVSFKIEGTDDFIFLTNGGAGFDPTLGLVFELDALCQKFETSDFNTGEHLIVGYIFGALSIYNY